MKPLHALLAPFFLVFSACATSPDVAADRSSARAMASVPQDGLETQVLAPGECGLFLWSRSGEPSFIFFSQAATGRAKMLIGAAQELLLQTGAGGDIFGQFNTQTRWRSNGSGHQIDLDLEPGEPLIDGQRVSEGRIKLTDQEGWETIIPVAGARACVNQPSADGSARP
jgi:hypothetical protein